MGRERSNLPCIIFTPRIKSIIHEKFTNDTILLGGTSALIASRFKTTLDNFLKASGGETNDSKNHNFTWNTTAQKDKKIEDTLWFKLVRDW